MGVFGIWRWQRGSRWTMDERTTDSLTQKWFIKPRGLSYKHKIFRGSLTSKQACSLIIVGPSSNTESSWWTSRVRHTLGTLAIFLACQAAQACRICRPTWNTKTACWSVFTGGCKVHASCTIPTLPPRIFHLSCSVLDLKPIYSDLPELPGSICVQPLLPCTSLHIQ